MLCSLPIPSWTTSLAFSSLPIPFLQHSPHLLLFLDLPRHPQTFVFTVPGMFFLQTWLTHLPPSEATFSVSPSLFTHSQLFIYVSTWLDHGVPRCLVKCYSDIWCMDVSVRMFLDEMNLWISRLSKADCPPKIWRGVILLIKDLNRTKRLE